MTHPASSLDPLAILLAALDSEPTRAAEVYERLRARLVGRFHCRGLPAPEDLADETFDRVARRLRDGEQPRDLVAYILGVGRLVGLEARRRALRTERLDDDIAAQQQSAPDLRIDRLAACLAELPAPNRELLLRYEDGHRTERIARRRELARELGIGLNALRIRVHRMREKVLALVDDGCAAGMRH